MLEKDTENCPLCKEKLFLSAKGKKICNKCEVEWSFDPKTGRIQFANFFGNKKQEVDKF